MRIAICNLLMLAAVVGCDQSSSKSSSPAQPTGTVIQPGPYEIRGQVKFDGPPPVVKEIDNSVCKHAAKIVDESVVAGPGGELKNAVVYLDRMIDGQPGHPLVPGAVLDQADCRFSPHVVAVSVGQSLMVKNGDAEVHNVHAEPSENASFNFATPPGSSHETAFRSAEFIRVKCDVHPWMTSYVAVLNSSFFAVTDEKGEFDLKGLPAGQYELTAWHERYGELKQSVEVKDGVAVVNFVYRAPQ